jgi:hypothetical protein
MAIAERQPTAELSLEPLRQASQCRYGFHPIESRMDRSASSDCSFLKKRRVGQDY